MALRIKSAKKKHRQSLKKRSRNNFVKTTLKTKTKLFNSAIEEKDIEKADGRLKEIISAYSKAATKGVIHKKNATRNISRFSKKVSALKAEGQSQS